MPKSLADFPRPAGGTAFLVVNLVMEASGWVVGGPGAVERATMLTVTSVGDLAAALAGGAVIGAKLGVGSRQQFEARRTTAAH